MLRYVCLNFYSSILAYMTSKLTAYFRCFRCYIAFHFATDRKVSKYLLGDRHVTICGKRWSDKQPDQAILEKKRDDEYRAIPFNISRLAEQTENRNRFENCFSKLFVMSSLTVESDHQH